MRRHTSGFVILGKSKNEDTFQYPIGTKINEKGEKEIVYETRKFTNPSYRWTASSTLNGPMAHLAQLRTFNSFAVYTDIIDSQITGLHILIACVLLL